MGCLFGTLHRFAAKSVGTLWSIGVDMTRNHIPLFCICLSASGRVFLRQLQHLAQPGGFANLARKIDILLVDQDIERLTRPTANSSSPRRSPHDCTSSRYGTSSGNSCTPRTVKNSTSTRSAGARLDLHPPPFPAVIPPAPSPSPCVQTVTVTVKASPARPAGAYRPPDARGQSASLAYSREEDASPSATPRGGNSGAATPTRHPNGQGRRYVPGALATASSPSPNTDAEKPRKSKAPAPAVMVGLELEPLGLRRSQRLL